jgi:hypothetical protein
MKLIDLVERLSAEVFVNDSKTLHVISNLVVDNFGLQFNKIGGGCLASQMVYSMSSVSGYKPEDIVTAINSSSLTGPFNGVTLENMYKFFDNKVLKIGGKKVKFQLSLNVYDTIDEGIDAVKSGQPITFIIGTNGDLLGKLNDTEYSNDGIVRISKSDMNNSHLTGSNTFHALLMIGYDSKGYVILRDMRSKYMFKGYAKISAKSLKLNPKAYKLLSIEVDSVKELK